MAKKPTADAKDPNYGTGEGTDDGDKIVDNPKPSVIEYAQKLMAAGLGEDLAIRTAQEELGLSQPARPAQRTPGDGEKLGPDPDMIAEYEQRMADYTPPKLKSTICEGGLTLKNQQARWVEQYRVWKSIERREELTPERAVELMIFDHWKDHSQDRAMLQGSKTGPADSFNAAAGAWNR